MTIEKRADIAANLKATGQCNCTQSVIKVFEDQINVAPEELTKLTELRNSLGLKHDNAAKDVHQPAAKPDEVKKAPEKKVLK